MITVQNVLISTLILQFSGKGGWGAVWVAALAAAGYALFSEEIVGPDTMVYIQAATIPLGLASKVPQIIEVARQKSTGQLSAFAVRSSLHLACWEDFKLINENHRSSTTSLAPSLGYSPHSQKSTIPSSSGDSSAVPLSTPSLLHR